MRLLAPRTAHEAATLPKLERDPRRSYGDPASENMLVHGENLRALALLRPWFEGRVRCIYIDPPFNTGRTFAEYKDQRAPEEWRAMMRARLLAMRPLLSDDGAIFAEIDDTELGYLQVLMDDVFGRENRVATVTIVRSATTGHKAKNAGPVNTTDFLLIYAKKKQSWRAVPQTRIRQGHDKAYSTYLENRESRRESWRFSPLAAHVAEALGHTSARDARRALGAHAWAHEIERFALSHAENVVRFAQPRYEAISQEAQRLVDRSKADPGRIYSLLRPGIADLILRSGNRLLFLSDKVRTMRGARVIVEPLTNVWDDVPFQGIAKEGGVVFSRNKKPERLIARILEMATEPGDWVLDPFLGSGTTAAVAHKASRRWIGIEEGEHAQSLCLPRLARVVDGQDASGVTRAYSWRGGGGFGVYA